ncbi:MAG TPA: hypothetical protein VED83_08215 [Burkholderiaceae bacterium]|nr:hypothetical protein [Burkholderiaceae bacterium]
MPDRTESCIKGDIADGSVELRGRLQLAGFELAQADRDRMTPRLRAAGDNARLLTLD